MKLFGKKTLALILALSMVMSVCVFAENATASVTVGATTTLETPSEAGEATVTWTSGDTNKATVDGGVVTGVAAGEVTITATWTPEGGTEQSKAWTVTVNPIAVTGVTLDVTSKEVVAGASFELAATVEPDTATDKTVTWSSSNEAVATVSGGTVTTKKPGTATITATAGEKSAACAVTVTEGVISKIEPDKASITVPYGTDRDVAATAVKTQVKLIATNENNKQFEVTAGTWTCASWDGAIDKANTFTTAYGEQTATVTVTFDKATMASGAANVGSMGVEIGTSKNAVLSELPDYVTLTMNNGKTVTFGIGSYTSSSTVDGCFERWGSSTYDYDDEGTYTFTSSLTTLPMPSPRVICMWTATS